MNERTVEFALLQNTCWCPSRTMTQWRCVIAEVAGGTFSFIENQEVVQESFT
jgi:hypothetical protein